MKTSLLSSPLRLYFSKKINVINSDIGESSNTEDALISNVSLDIKAISVIGHKVLVGAHKKEIIKILLVENNKADQILISSLLRKENYQFDIVKNGWEAICAVEACKYDLILMRIKLPILDGDEATIAIRKTNKAVPIIALTDNNICEEVFQDKLYMGFNDVVSKPIDNELLLTTIRNLIMLYKRSIQESPTDPLTWAS